MKIYKYVLIRPEETLQIPSNYKILSVGLDPNDKICLWAQVHPNNIEEKLDIFIIPTGNEIPDNAQIFLGTVIRGPFVLHIFRNQDILF